MRSENNGKQFDERDCLEIGQGENKAYTGQGQKPSENLISIRDSLLKPDGIYKKFFDLKDLQHVTRFGAIGWLDKRQEQKEREDDFSNDTEDNPNANEETENGDVNLFDNSWFTREKYKLVYMTPTFSNIKPIHYVRVMDYMFPLDSSFLNSDKRKRLKYHPIYD